MERIKHFTLRTLTTVSAITLLFSLSVMMVLNSGILDQLARKTLVDRFEEKYFGKLVIDELHLNFPNNVTLVRPRIYGIGDKTPALAARTLSLKVNILSLLRPNFTNLMLRKFSADSVSATLVKGKDGKLNIATIFTRKKPYQPLLDQFFCKTLRLTNATVTYHSFTGDSLATQTITSLNTELSDFTVKKKLLKGSLESLRLTIPEKKVTLREGAGTFRFTDTLSEILNLKATTGKSSVELSASLNDVSIFAPDLPKRVLQSKSFINVQSLLLHSDDIALLFPGHPVPAGTYTAKGNIKLQNEEILINDLLLGNKASKLAIKGKLFNLENKEAFAYDIVCDSSTVSAALTEELLQNSPYRDLVRQIGDVKFAGTARGTLKAIKTDLFTRSKAGDITVNGEASQDANQRIQAKGKIGVKNGKPHLLLVSSPQKSLLNGTATVETIVSGNELQVLKLDATLGDSFWHNQTIKEGTLAGQYENRQLHAQAMLNSAPAYAMLDATIDWKGLQPSYRATMKSTKLNVASFLDTKGASTDLNGTFMLEGRGFDPATLNANLSMQFAPSVINGVQFADNAKVSIDLVQLQETSKTRIRSDFIDLDVEGNYSIRELVDTATTVATSIRNEIAAQNIWRPTLPPRSDATLQPQEQHPFSLAYSLAIKDSAPFALFMPLNGFSMQGKAVGKAKRSKGQSLLSSTLEIENLNSSVENIACKRLNLDLSLICNNGNIAETTASGSLLSLSIKGYNTGNTFFSGKYQPGTLEANVSAAIPKPEETLATKFIARRIGSRYNIQLDHLALRDNNGSWETKNENNISVGKSDISFNGFTLRKGNQGITLDGELNETQPSRFQCTLQNIELNEIRHFGIMPAIDALSGKVNASLQVSGTPGYKTSYLTVRGQGIQFDKMVFGTVSVSASHAGKYLDFTLESFVPDLKQHNDATPTSSNTIQGSGRLPLELSYFPFKLQTIRDQPVRATIKSDNLSAEIVKNFSNLFSSVEGTMPTVIHVEGKMPSPDISINARLRNTRIRLEPTLVSYTLNGELHITPASIELRDISIRDELKGTGVITGEIGLEKLRPRTLFLAARINKLLLFNKKDRQDDKSYGSVTGTTNNISLNGTINAPVLDGEMRIDDANFFLYRYGANESAKYVGIERFIGFVPRNANSVDRIGSNDVSATKTAEFHHSLIDIIQIQKLKLTSIEPLKYTVIFDNNRGEILETIIDNLSVIVNKNRQQFSLFGSVNIIGGMYKFSNSNFDLENGGQITWNNVDIRNGVMHNLYGRKFISASNQQNNDRDQVNLLLAMTGTLNNPQVSMGYYLNEQAQPYGSTTIIGSYPSQIDPNAELNVISLLLSKQWYVRPGSTGQASNLAVSSAGFSAGTGILSSRLSKIVQEVGGLESFNVNVGVDNTGTLSGLDLYLALNVPGTQGKVRFIGTGSSPDLGSSAFADYYGTTQKIEYRITPKLYLEASRSFGLNANGTTSSNLQKPTETWGISLSYKEQFRTWGEFLRRLFPFSERKK